MTTRAAWRMLARRSLVALIALAGSTVLAAADFRPIEVVATPIERFSAFDADQRFGRLTFRGGLALDSPTRLFGSLSGLDFASDGTLYAVSDKGRWFAARPVEENGRLVGLADTRIAPILNHAGVPLAGKRWGDAEALRILPGDGGDSALVAFEQVNDLRAFPAGDFALAASQPVQLPASARALSRNGGLEAVAVAPPDGPLAGAILLLAEHSLDAQGNHRGWILGGPRAGSFFLERDNDFDVTDAVFLPGGDLLVLERRLSFPFGFTMRIRQIAEADLAPGATVGGEVLIEADLRDQVDNMEGIAVRRNDDGETIVALVSDDNNNPLQRTLLLYFALEDG